MRAVKESLCFMSTDFDKDDRAVNDRPADLRREYLLPDGTELPVVAERFKPPEMLLHPELVGLFGNKENLGLHHRVVQAVRGCAEAIQVGRLLLVSHSHCPVLTCAATSPLVLGGRCRCGRSQRGDGRHAPVCCADGAGQVPLFKAVVLCGATTLLPGFVGRFKGELEGVAPRALKPGPVLITPPEEDRPWMVPIGGTVLVHCAAGLPGFWVTKADYDECGPSTARRRRRF